MRKLLTIGIIFTSSLLSAQNKLGAIGQWRAHFDNHSIQQIVKGDIIYAASPFQIIGIDSMQNKYWMDKSTGLHEIDIKLLAWDPTQNQLIISYANSNIDILKRDQIFNINAIQLSTQYPNHTINAIRVYNQWAFVATNFGIVVIDLLNHEIKDTWYPNNNQQSTITFDIAIANDTLLAATENGLWSCPFQHNWIVPNKWNALNNFNAIGITALIVQSGNIYGYNKHSIFKMPSITPIANFIDASIQKIDTTQNGFNACIQYPNNKGALIQFNKDLSLATLVDTTQLIAPMGSIADAAQLWIADSVQGLWLKKQMPIWINLGGPKASIQGKASINELTLVAPFGKQHPGFASFEGNEWNSITQIGNVKLHYLNAAAISKQDNSFWFTNNTGLSHLTNNNTQIENISPNQLLGNYTAIQIDQNNSVWALQDNQGLVKQTNTNWNTLSIPGNLSRNGLNQFIVNNQGQAWVIAPNNQGIYLYQSKDNYTTEIWKQLNTQASNGNLPSMHVTSIANDITGSVWVGTDNGIGIFNCGDISTEPCNAYLPIVNNNGFNGYLFQHETVNCIAVDGANRKWIGTNNGAWLLSVDGLEIIEHFIKANSPLPTDTILQILIAPKSGEVFFNTSKQMVSYRGTATQGKTTQSNIQIFPNPIPPYFNGTIAIRGLVENALVKITDLSGKLLYQTQALGGQAIWNGRTYEGKKVATGIYLVFARDQAGNENTVGKIVIADGY